MAAKADVTGIRLLQYDDGGQGFHRPVRIIGGRDQYDYRAGVLRISVLRRCRHALAIVCHRPSQGFLSSDHGMCLPRIGMDRDDIHLSPANMPSV